MRRAPPLHPQLGRYTMAADWTAVKIDASVPVPLTLRLGADGGAPVAIDLRAAGRQAGEADLDALAEAAGPVAAAAAAAAPAAAAPDAALVAQLMVRGGEHSGGPLPVRLSSPNSW